MLGYLHSLTGISPSASVANYSPYAVPAMWMITMVPHFYAAGLTKGKFTNRSPREYNMTIYLKPKKERWERKYLRAEAAQLNGFENLGFFAAAIALGNAAHLSSSELNHFAGAYLLSRIAFNLLYIVTESEAVSPLRSVVYVLGIALNSSMFIKACKALNP